MSVRVGFIGAGWISGVHMDILREMDDVEIVGIYDADAERASAAALENNIVSYRDFSNMLETARLDALYICVPPYAHEGQELAAIDKGIHIFVEKPVALDMTYAQKVSDRIEAQNLVSASGYHWRYLESTEQAKEMLEERKIGMVIGRWMDCMINVKWWREFAKSGGQMVEQATHVFDLARYLCGDVEEVFAAYANRVSQNVEYFTGSDVGTATIKFENGIIGTISTSCMLTAPYTKDLSVIAEDMVLDITQDDLTINTPGRTEVFKTGGVPYMKAFTAEHRAFIDAVKNRDPKAVRSPYSNALKTLAVTLACNESAATGKPVKIRELSAV